MTYNAFCRSILDVCGMSEHGFSFNAQDDPWDYPSTGRPGVSLAHFQQRWQALLSIPHTEPTQVHLEKDSSPLEVTCPTDPQPLQTGSASVLDDDMAKLIRDNQVAQMAAMFLETCPNDWTRGWGPGFYTKLKRASNKEDTLDEDIDVAAAIQFRWELGLLADQIVEMFKLPAPNSQRCLWWDDIAWKRSLWDGRISGSGHLKTVVFLALSRGGFQPYPCPFQGPPFPRFALYVAAAIVEAQMGEEEALELVEELLKFMGNVKTFYRWKAQASEAVMERKNSWVKSLQGCHP